MDTIIRTLLTKFGIHHFHASVPRLYVPREESGRGLPRLEITHKKIVKDMREYFQTENSPFFEVICQEDENIPTLNLASRRTPSEAPTIETPTKQWYGKILHGRYPEALKSN